MAKNVLMSYLQTAHFELRSVPRRILMCWPLNEAKLRLVGSVVVVNI